MLDHYIYMIKFVRSSAKMADFSVVYDTEEHDKIRKY